MSEYQQAVDMHADADHVFEFVSSPENLPRFLPTLTKARGISGGRIAMEGVAGGRPYRAEGELHLDPDERTMHWRSDGDHTYRGELHVTGDDHQCSVAVRLTFEPGEPMKNALEQERHSADRRINEALGKSLETIKEICESAANLRSGGDRGYLY